MVINWPFLLLGLLMLWFPRSWMRRGKSVLRRRKRAVSQPTAADRESGDPRLSFPQEFSKPRNYFDLLRGVAGGLALIGSGPIPSALAPEEASGSAMRWIVFGCQFAILFIGLLAQILRSERGHLALFAPVFFLAGVGVALCGPWAALFAFAFIWGVNPILPNAHAFLCLDAVALIVFGYVLGESERTLVLTAGLLSFFPALLSWMIRRPLAVFSRKTFRPMRGVS